MGKWTAVETVESHDVSPELTKGFGFKVYGGEGREGLVSKEQFGPPASVCYWSKSPAGTAAAGEVQRSKGTPEGLLMVQRDTWGASLRVLSALGRPGSREAGRQPLGFSESKWWQVPLRDMC